MMNRLKFFYSNEALLLLVIFILYIMTSPFTVQSGDTGELVTNSYFLRVSHPPGYPLWSLLHHIPIRYLPLETPYLSAAIFTALITVCWLGVLLYRFRNKESLSLITVVATSLLFWRYAVLPDVFSLHLLFLTLVFIVFMEPKLIDRPWIIFLISLSVANHHTIVFFFPLYLYAVIKNPSKKTILYSLVFGLLSMSIYCVLFLFHPMEYGSWGEIDTFKELVNHFLRKEYGTFSLHDSSYSGFRLSWLHLMVMNLLTNSWSILIALFYVMIRYWKELRIHWVKVGILTLSTIGYLVSFLVLMSAYLNMDFHGETVFERFLLQPILSIFFLTLMVINLTKAKLPKWVLMGFLINAGVNVTQNYAANDYRHNTIIEDNTLNILRSLPEKSIYHAISDTQGNAAYYVHELLKVRPDVILLHPNLNFPWSAAKAQAKYPDAVNFEKKAILDGINFEKYSFFTNLPAINVNTKYGLIFSGTHFQIVPNIEKWDTIQFRCAPYDSYQWRTRSTEESFNQFEISHFYDLEYGRCDYTLGLEQLSKGELKEAQQSFEKSVKLSPYSAKFYERLCFVYKELKNSNFVECEARYEELLNISNQQYYLLKY